MAPSNKEQVTAGQWLLSLRLLQLRQQEPPGITCTGTHKVYTHHRKLSPSSLALSIRINAQNSKGGMGKAAPKLGRVLPCWPQLPCL